MDRKSVLEVGFVLMALGFLGGLGVLVGGRLVGDRHRRRGFDETVPVGAVPGERHQHLSPSAR
jgi:type VI protein secretion system component VasF